MRSINETIDLTFKKDKSTKIETWSSIVERVYQQTLNDNKKGFGLQSMVNVLPEMVVVGKLHNLNIVELPQAIKIYKLLIKSIIEN